MTLCYETLRMFLYSRNDTGSRKPANLSDSLHYNSRTKYWFFFIVLLQLAVGQKTLESPKEIWCRFYFPPGFLRKLKAKLLFIFMDFILKTLSADTVNIVYLLNLTSSGNQGKSKDKQV